MENEPKFVRADLIEEGREYWQVQGRKAGVQQDGPFKISTARIIRVDKISKQRVIFEISGERPDGQGRFSHRHDTRQSGAMMLCHATDKAVLDFKAEEKRKAEARAEYEKSDEFKAERLRMQFVSFFENRENLSLDTCRRVVAAISPEGFETDLLPPIERSVEPATCPECKGSNVLLLDMSEESARIDNAQCRTCYAKFYVSDGAPSIEELRGIVRHAIRFANGMRDTAKEGSITEGSACNFLAHVAIVKEWAEGGLS